MARLSNLASQYSVYDTLMRGRRARRAQRRFFEKLDAPEVSGKTISTDTEASGTGISGSSAGPIKFQDLTGVTGTSPFTEAGVSFVKDASGNVRKRSDADQYATEKPTFITRGEAATADSTAIRGYGMFGDPRGKTADYAYSTALSRMPSVPFVGDLIGGTTAYNPYGKEVAVPLGTLGKFARMNIRKQYDVYDKIQQGLPGYHQFYNQGQLLSIVPQNLTADIGLGFTVLGTYDGNAQAMINRYAANLGYDPSTIDLNKKAGTKGFGKELKAFVYGSGGVTDDGEFVNSKGETKTTPRDVKAHLGLVNDLYGREETLDVLNSLNMGESYTNALKEALDRGELVAEEVVVDGEVVGYSTGSGGAVTTTDGTPIDKGKAGYGTGTMPKSQYESIRSKIAEDKLEEDTQKNKGALDRLEQRAQDSIQQAALDRPEAYEKFQKILVGDDSDRGRDTEQADADSAGGSSYSSPFAEGGQAPVGPASGAPVVNQAGFVGQEPEELPEGMTVADDVNIDVPEGTFILNAAAVEFMGSADVKKMILEAVAEAEKQGIDINQDDTKISREDLVSLAVSRGEVVVPPELAKVIGYDRLNKINNRGKAEVEKRVQENGQSPQAEALDQSPQNPSEGMPMSEGGKAPRRVLPLKAFKSYNTGDSITNYMNFFENVGASVLGKRDDAAKSLTYARDYADANQTEDNIEDTMRHILLGGLYSGDPDQNRFQQFLSDTARGFADYKETSVIGAKDAPKEAQTEAKIDLNNNQYGGALRKLYKDEDEFVDKVEEIMNLFIAGKPTPQLKTEDGAEIGLMLSTITSREADMPVRQRQAPGGFISAGGKSNG